MVSKKKPRAAQSLPRTKADCEATAHHEAGHAVMSLAFGIPIIHVSILPDAKGNLGTCGHPNPCELYDGSRRDIRRLARCCILVSYAGVPAQRLVDSKPEDFHGESDDESAFNTSKHFQVFPRFMQYVGDDLHRAYLEMLRNQARRLIHQNEAAVRHLAKVLLAKKKMSGEQVEAALRGFALVA